MSHPLSFSTAASSEFMALCQSQVMLLRQGLGASWSAVYLTETTDDKPAKLIPVVVYPQTDWQDKTYAALRLKPTAERLLKAVPEAVIAEQSLPSSLSGETAITHKNQQARVLQGATHPGCLIRETEGAGERMTRQIVLPLVYEEAMMGLIVTRRDDRNWKPEELTQVETIAETLAIACLLDRRQQWYLEQLEEQHTIRRRERDRLDDLLHQLRNPLTALRTFSKLLLKRLLPEDRNRQVAQSLLRESDRLQDLVQEFEGSLAPIETSTLSPVQTDIALPAETAPILVPPLEASLAVPYQLKLASVAISEVLAPLLTSAEAIAQERNIALESAILIDLPPLQADAKALREVLSNLIDNALKYTPAGGQIKIQAGLTPATPTQMQGIAIHDTGYGIPLSDRQQLFQRHYRGVQARGAIPGSGLGLAIAKELVEQMQGKIELISPSPFARDRSAALPGTTVIVWLPTEADALTVESEERLT